MPILEVQAADSFVYGALSADAALTGLLTGGVNGIFNQNPLISSLTPYVVYDNRPMNDLLTNGNVRCMASFNCLVQGAIYDVLPQTKSVADQIAALIDADLFQEGVSQNGYWICCERLKPINRAQQIDNRPFRFVGAYYTLTLRPLSEPG